MDAAVNQAIDQANQTNNDIGWMMAGIFIIGPVVIIFAVVIVAIIKQHELKCPKCGNWRRNKPGAIQTVRTVDGGKTTITTQRLVTCRKCKHEFVV